MITMFSSVNIPQCSSRYIWMVFQVHAKANFKYTFFLVGNRRKILCIDIELKTATFFKLYCGHFYTVTVMRSKLHVRACPICDILISSWVRCIGLRASLLMNRFIQEKGQPGKIPMNRCKKENRFLLSLHLNWHATVVGADIF